MIVVLSLQLKVSGKNLLNICKLVFKISRSEKNDTLMQKDNILRESPSVLGAGGGTVEFQVLRGKGSETFSF